MHVSPYALGHEVNRVDSAELVLAQRVFGPRGSSFAQGTTGPTGATGATGASGGAIVKIAKVVCSGSQSTIVFSSISNAYTDLRISFLGRLTGATAVQQVRIQFNGDTTAANYLGSQYVNGIANTAASNVVATSSSGGYVFDCAGTSAATNPLTQADISIPAYASTVLQKAFTTTSRCTYNSSDGQEAIISGGQWKSTGAITGIILTVPSGSFLDGTTATLYGLG